MLVFLSDVQGVLLLNILNIVLWKCAAIIKVSYFTLCWSLMLMVWVRMCVRVCVCKHVYYGVSACCECVCVCVCVCVKTERLHFSQTLSVKLHIFTEIRSRHIFNETFSHSSLLVLSRFAVFAHFLLKLSRWAHFLRHIQSYHIVTEIFSHHVYLRLSVLA